MNVNMPNLELKCDSADIKDFKFKFKPRSQGAIKSKEQKKNY